jgi:sec-independent protein translocase protein TatC
MSSALRPIKHDDRLSLIEHLDELRTRLIICIAVFVVAFGLCLWQNDAILGAMNAPLEQTAFKPCGQTQDPFERTACAQAAQRVLFDRLGTLAVQIDRAAVDDPALRRAAQQVAVAAAAAERATPKADPRRPVTLGVGEPFIATVKLAAYAALLISLPLVLYQGYAFILPAFSPEERRVVIPLMAMVPVLFVGGAAFGYFVVLPNAVDFLQNFNDDQFDILLQARDYYRFAIMVLIAMGLLFQIPVGILALTRTGVLTVAQLRANRRYALLVIAVMAMLLPGTDPVTMLLAMAPLLVLYEGSILLAALLDRRAARSAARRGDAPDDGAEPDHEPDPEQAAES